LLAVLYGAGLRRSEATAIQVGDYNATTGELRIIGAKGNKDRLAYVTNGARAAIDAWLAVRGPEPGPLFLPINKGGRVTMRAMTDQAIYGVLVKRAQDAGIPHFSPHDLRRSCVGDMLDAGAEVSLVQQLAGHANVSTTLRYNRRPEHAKRKAAELLYVPFEQVS
jgi:integrase